MLNAVQTGTRTIDGATVHVLPDVAAMARSAADEALAVMRSAVDSRGAAHVMFATGNSQLAFVHALVHETAGVPWADTIVFHMDEYVGVGPDHPAGFQRWIRERIVEPARPKAAYYVEGLGDAEAECRRYSDLLRRYPLDLCCLGVGENGHLAFNDPPVADFADQRDVKVVELEAACRLQQVNEGHFPGPRRRARTRHHGDRPGPPTRRSCPRRRSRGAQGGARRRRADRARHHGVPGLCTADDLPRRHLPRAGLGAAAARLRAPDPGSPVSGPPMPGDVVEMMNRVVQQVEAEAGNVEAGAVATAARPEPLLVPHAVEGVRQTGGGVT